MAEAPAKKEGEPDASMEEILQSIRTIIAEDGDDAKPAAANGSSDVTGSDVLELTNMVAEPAPAPAPAAAATPATPAVPAMEAPKAAAPAPAPAPAASADVLSAIDQVLATPAASSAPSAPMPQVAPGDPGLLSSRSETAAVASIKKLQAAAQPPLPPLVTTPAPRFASGKTVEDMVAEMLMPMIKGWLDANLPAIVERIVEREVRRLSSR